MPARPETEANVIRDEETKRKYEAPKLKSEKQKPTAIDINRSLAFTEEIILHAMDLKFDEAVSAVNFALVLMRKFVGATKEQVLSGVSEQWDRVSEQMAEEAHDKIRKWKNENDKNLASLTGQIDKFIADVSGDPIKVQ